MSEGNGCGERSTYSNKRGFKAVAAPLLRFRKPAAVAAESRAFSGAEGDSHKKPSKRENGVKKSSI